MSVEQEIYDALPSELRHLLAEAPFPISAAFVDSYYRSYGLENTMARVRQGIADMLEATREQR